MISLELPWGQPSGSCWKTSPQWCWEAVAGGQAWYHHPDSVHGHIRSRDGVPQVLLSSYNMPGMHRGWDTADVLAAWTLKSRGRERCAETNECAPFCQLLTKWHKEICSRVWG